MQAYERTLPSVDTIRELYFCSIDGVEGSTRPRTNACVRNGVKAVKSVKYEANERGTAYASTRKAAISPACKELSTNY
jgi:hypothetical protein